MANRFTFLVIASLIAGLLGGCVEQRHIPAVTEIVSVITVSNDELIDLSRKMRAEGDAKATVAAANSRYARRLERLTTRFAKDEGRGLNFKVYVTKEVNANATADGSIRMYSGLMDMMTDNELTFVLAHEVAHVKDSDSLDAVRMAYTSSAAIKAAAASGGTAGYVFSQSQLGELLHAVLNAQFSQKQESDADAFAYAMMRKYKIDSKAAVSALQKIDRLGASGGILASHPNAGARAQAIQKMIEADGKR